LKGKRSIAKDKKERERNLEGYTRELKSLRAGSEKRNI
jgi:hypothetical protein